MQATSSNIIPAREEPNGNTNFSSPVKTLVAPKEAIKKQNSVPTKKQSTKKTVK